MQLVTVSDVFLALQAASLVPFFNFYFLASPLIFMLVYVWSRNFPSASVSIMGFFSVEVCYVCDHALCTSNAVT